MTVKIHIDSRCEAWATYDGEGFGVACFSLRGLEPHTIGKVRANPWSNIAEIHHHDAEVAEKLPKVAALFGVELGEQKVADAIAACRLALAERALAELKVAEEMARARAGAGA